MNTTVASDDEALDTSEERPSALQAPAQTAHPQPVHSHMAPIEVGSIRNSEQLAKPQLLQIPPLDASGSKSPSGKQLLGGLIGVWLEQVCS